MFDTLLDEQTVLGTALGAALAGLLPIPEIQYLAYLHNAEDQLRGEAASLAFFSNGQYRNGMVVRVAGLGYQKGFGGHFHNDNSLAVLRDVPGLVLVACVPSGGRTGAAADLCGAGGRRTARSACSSSRSRSTTNATCSRAMPPGWRRTSPPLPRTRTLFGKVAIYGAGEDLLLVTFGNGVRMSMRAAARLDGLGVTCTVLDLRWLVPLPSADLLDHVRRFRHVLVVDETRAGGGVSEGVLAALVDAGVRRERAARDQPRQLRATRAGRRPRPAVGGRRSREELSPWCGLRR